MTEESKALLQKIADKKASEKAAMGLAIAEIGKATTIAHVKAVLIKMLTVMEK